MLDNHGSDQALITKRATEWFAKLRDGEFSELEYRCYLHWLSESPAHAAELFRVDQLHRLLRRTLTN
jgi:ferric-dicitrate binding protein FerR (iron transport regulator)